MTYKVGKFSDKNSHHFYQRVSAPFTEACNVSYAQNLLQLDNKYQVNIFYLMFCESDIEVYDRPIHTMQNEKGTGSNMCENDTCGKMVADQTVSASHPWEG